MPDRLNAIKARARDALTEQEGDWMQACDFGLPRASALFYERAPHDLAWLIAEVERLRREQSGYVMDVRHVPHDGRTHV